MAGRALSFFTSKKFLIPAAIIALLLAIVGGTYLAINHQTKQAVAAAVTNVNTTATVQTLQKQAQIQTQYDVITVIGNHQREQITKDYTNVKNTISNAPVAQREAPVPALIINTLNELDRLSLRRRDAGTIPPDSTTGR
jgi:hypothetical protein